MPTGLADSRDSPRNNFLRHLAMPGSSRRTIVIFEMKYVALSTSIVALRLMARGRTAASW